MREIKFRAWDRGVGMIDDWAVVKPISSTMPDLTVSTKHRSPPYYIEAVMQYTGLKDKNGVEIYEGDIVQNQALVDSVIIVEGVTTLTRSGYDKFFVKQPLAVHDGLEVIGNICENPKLLEAKVSG